MVCRKCGEDKPETEYTGKHKSCRTCRSAMTKAWRERQKEGSAPKEEPPYSAGDVFLLIQKTGWDVPLPLAEKEKARFIRLDTKIEKITARRGQPVPCRTCPPKVLTYCAQTGTECRKFLRWAGPD